MRAPPHLVSTSTPGSEASHEPDCTMTGVEPSSGRWTMSPGKVAVSVISPPAGARKVLMKKLSPPSSDRFRPRIMPPWAWVWISTPPDMLVMAPASAFTSAPGGNATAAMANDGLYLMSTCIVNDSSSAWIGRKHCRSRAPL